MEAMLNGPNGLNVTLTEPMASLKVCTLGFMPHLVGVKDYDAAVLLT